MWTVSECICLFLLSVMAVADMRTREVSVSILWTGFIASILYQFVARDNFILIAGGVLIGGLFLMISKVTGEGMGYGDSSVILSLGIFLGFWNILMVLSITFFLLFCVSVPMIWKRRMSRTCTIPFLPFLAAGYLCFLLTGGANV